MSGVQSIGRWFGHTVAGGIVEGFAFVAVVSISLSLWSWLKGATFEQAVLLGLFAIVLLALALYFVSLAVFKFREGQRSSEQDQPSNATNAQACPDTWLHDIAFEQANSLENYIDVECWMLKHRLVGDDPYIDFNFHLSNRSVFGLTLTDVSGFINFGADRLSIPPVLTENLVTNLTAKEPKNFLVFQRLRPSEAVMLLNHNGQFDFREMRANLSTNPSGGSVVIPWRLNEPRIDNEFIDASYPKLDFKILSATSEYVTNLQTWNAGSDGEGIITLQLDIKSLRPSRSSIESFRVEALIPTNLRIASAQTGEIWEKKIIDESGRLRLEGKLNNLAGTRPLNVDQAGASGYLQFLFPNEGARMLQTIGFTLIATETSGERHSIEGLIERKTGDES
jgi:hypothetical protein